MSRSDHSRRGLLTRLAFDADGRLRGWRLIGIAAAVAFLLTFGGLAAAVIAGAGNPEALSIWVTVAFFAIKLPVLGLLWFVLGRSEHAGTVDAIPDDRARSVVARLRERADAAVVADDAWDRYDALRSEAQYVAAHSSPEMAAEARLLVEELTALRDGRRDQAHRSLRVRPHAPR